MGRHGLESTSHQKFDHKTELNGTSSYCTCVVTTIIIIRSTQNVGSVIKKIHFKSQFTFRAGLVEFRTPWNPAMTSLWTSDACFLTLPGNNWRWMARSLWRHFPLPVVPPLTRYWWAVRWLWSAMLTISGFLSHFWSQRPPPHSRCDWRRTLEPPSHCSHCGRCTFRSLSATDARTCRCCPRTPLRASSNRSLEVRVGTASSSARLNQQGQCYILK